MWGWRWVWMRWVAAIMVGVVFWLGPVGVMMVMWMAAVGSMRSMRRPVRSMWGACDGRDEGYAWLNPEMLVVSTSKVAKHPLQHKARLFKATITALSVKFSR